MVACATQPLAPGTLGGGFSEHCLERHGELESVGKDHFPESSSLQAQFGDV